MKLQVYHNSKSYPDRAGIAQLIYKDIPNPSRKGDIITIPSDNYGLYILPNTSQFLLLQSGEKKRAWFGGTDEQPFLVELNDMDCYNESLFYPMWVRHQFYDEIKPDIIKLYEKKYGIRGTVRQGDFFGYPLPEQRWEKIMEWSQAFARQEDYFSTKNGSLPLNETRHRFQGDICSFTGNIIAKGIITAPDHKTLELTQICVLAQTKHLMDAKNAD